MTVNANRFIAPVINTTLLPTPDAIETLDVEALVASRMAEFQRRADEAGFPYDIGGLETDPIAIDQQAHAYRELLMRARVNSAVRAVLPAYAQGADLDAIAARANVARLIVTPADPNTGAEAVHETDAQLLLRYLTSFAVPSAGSADGYIYRAAMAAPALRDIAVLGPETHETPGRVDVQLLWDEGEPAPTDVVTAVREAVTASDAKPLTDWVVVSAAPVEFYDVVMTISLPYGPAPLEVANAVKAQIQAAADARYAIGADVWRNVLEGAGYLANVKKVTLTEPAEDITPGPYAAAYCASITVNTEVS